MKLKLILISIILVLISCASANHWYNVGVSNEKKVWRFCSTQRDGVDKNKKGFCYIDKECKNRFLQKRKCRQVPLFCAWGDVECMEKYGLFNKVIRSRQ